MLLIDLPDGFIKELKPFFGETDTVSDVKGET